MKQNKPTQVQIDRDLFADLCFYFELLEMPNYTNKKELEVEIKEKLKTKIEAIERRFAYQDVLKAEKGSEEYEQAILRYLQLK